MKSRSANEGFDFHTHIPVRVYACDPIQSDRIKKACQYVSLALDETKGNTLIELGCGTADISGAFSNLCNVLGIDASQKALAAAKERFPKMGTFVDNIVTMPALDNNILVLCELLEHLENPMELVKKWLPRSEYCVISHPLDEPVDSNWAAGEHQWSYSIEDFYNWFAVGGHKILKMETFQMGLYTVVIGVGKNEHWSVRSDSQEPSVFATVR